MESSTLLRNTTRGLAHYFRTNKIERKEGREDGEEEKEGEGDDINTHDLDCSISNHELEVKIIWFVLVVEMGIGGVMGVVGVMEVEEVHSSLA